MQLPPVRNSDSPTERLAVARDLWPRGTLDLWTAGVDGPLPDRVFWPRDADEVLQVLRAATAARVPVVTWGAGSGVCGGARGRVGAWVLDTRGMGRIGPLDAEHFTVTVEAGVNGQQLEDWLGTRGFTLGHSPSSIACSTVGGWAAARSAGQFSSKYGVFEDMVLGLVFVSPGGGIQRLGLGADVQGDADGDERLGCVLGSEGTLGVVTELTLRVWPRPEARWLRGYRVADVSTAVDLMRELMQAELHPSAVRLYDPVDTRIGGRTRPKKEAHGDRSTSLVRRWLDRVDALPEVHRRTLALPLALPRLVNRLLDGVATGCLLVVGFEGDPAVVAAASTAAAALLSAGAEDLGAEPGERWYASRHAVSYKLMPVFERGGFADTMEVAVRWSRLEATWKAVRAALAPHAVTMAHMSHLYPEGGSIYFSFAGAGDQATYQEVWKQALRAVAASGATTTHHHGVGELKAEAATDEVGPAVEGWRSMRAELDPAGVMNPDRLFRARAAPTAASLVAPPAESDGLCRTEAGASRAARWSLAEPGFPAADWRGHPRWTREPWQQVYTEVEGSVDGVSCRLGRGPRSATGPDLRPWLLRHGATHVAFPSATPGPRVMGRLTHDRPWSALQTLLRADLRPGAAFVRDGALYVGFRGPAAEAFLRLAGARLDAVLERVPWEVVAAVAGPLEPTEPDDPSALHATTNFVFRRARDRKSP